MPDEITVRMYTRELLAYWRKDWPAKYRAELLALWRENAKRTAPMWQSYRNALQEIDRAH